MVAAWECGWGPLGQRLLDRSLSVELLGSFPGPRPMTGCLRMLPIIRLTEHKGATLGLSRPDAWDGCTGALGPHHRGQGHTGVERAALTRRNENHFLQPHRRQREKNDQGLIPSGKGRPPLLSPETRPRRPRRPPRCQQWRGSNRGGGNILELWRGAKPLASRNICSGETPTARPAAPTVCN